MYNTIQYWTTCNNITQYSTIPTTILNVIVMSIVQYCTISDNTQQYRTILNNTNNNIIRNSYEYCTILYNIRQHTLRSYNIWQQYLHIILYDIVVNFVSNIYRYCRQYQTISKTKFMFDIVVYCTIQNNLKQNATISNKIKWQHLKSILYDIVLRFVTIIVWYCQQY